MRIQLHQTEIEEALQQYIATQGISLVGKAVKIGFTSSRSEAGLTADVDITNAEPAKQQAAAPAKAAVQEAVAVEAEVPEVAQEEKAEAAPAEEEPTKEVTPASSLFS
jgi:hypothetical protein